MELKSLRFRYDTDSPWILNGIDLTIRRSRIGLIGSTGSGKSTMIDIIMGLLEPTEGSILVDGQVLYENNSIARVSRWKSLISTVPQSIFLADGTIAENIAFGQPKHLIDMEKVKFAAEKLQISSYIQSCRDGYNTFVGERGIRLSGGQRQRIGIARALYKQVPIIILDEATSALDEKD